MARILYAEDSKDWQSIVARGLKRDAHVVHTAVNGAEAFRQLENGVGYELVITDGEMPVMNGLRLLEQIRASRAFRHLPVIVLTGRDDWEDEVKKRGGIYIMKGGNFSSEVLCQAVATALAPRQ